MSATPTKEKVADLVKEINIDGQLETIDTTQWYPRITRKDFTVGLNVSESAVDAPSPDWRSTRTGIGPASAKAPQPFFQQA